MLVGRRADDPRPAELLSGLPRPAHQRLHGHGHARAGCGLFPYTRTVAIAAGMVLVGLLLVLAADRRVHLARTSRCRSIGTSGYLAITGITLVILGFSTFTFTLMLHAIALFRSRRAGRLLAWRRGRPERATAYGQSESLSAGRPLRRLAVRARAAAARRRLRREALGATSAAATTRRFTRSLLDERRAPPSLVDVALADDLGGTAACHRHRGRPARRRLRGTRRPLARRGAVHLGARAPLASRTRRSRELRRVAAPGGVCARQRPVLARQARARVLRLPARPQSRPRRWTTTRRYYDPRDLWPLLVRGRLPAARHPLPPAQARSQHVRRCRVDRRRRVT